MSWCRLCTQARLAMASAAMRALLAAAVASARLLGLFTLAMLAVCVSSCPVWFESWGGVGAGAVFELLLVFVLCCCVLVGVRCHVPSLALVMPASSRRHVMHARGAFLPTIWISMPRPSLKSSARQHSHLEILLDEPYSSWTFRYVRH